MIDRLKLTLCAAVAGLALLGADNAAGVPTRAPAPDQPSVGSVPVSERPDVGGAPANEPSTAPPAYEPGKDAGGLKNPAPQSEADAGPLTRPNPEAEMGKLANGLRYAVMYRGGTRQVSIILYVGAGSEDETEAERGDAHFLEHMAFNGSKNFPPGTVMKRFADIGASIGRDQNAETSFDNTTFSLDLSEVTPDRLDMAFQWLGDVAYGLDIDQSQVDRERGVILSEYASSRSAMTDIAVQGETFMTPDLLGPKRLPIGTRETINAANAEMLRSFYHQWYRPETSIVVAVGDLPREELKARIEQTFGGWTDATPAATKPNLGHIDMTRPTAALAIADSHIPPAVQICRAMAKDPDVPEGVASREQDFEQAVWQSVLQQRLSALSSSGTPPFVGASADRNDLYDVASVSCVASELRDQAWRPALDAIAAETRRMELYGVTNDEYQVSLKALNAQVEAEVGEAPTMTAAQLAKSIVSNMTLGGTFSTAEEDQRIGRLALADLSRDKINGEFARVWTKSAPPLIVAVTGDPVASADVGGAWNLAEAASPPAPPAEHQGSAWAYGDFGPTGTVASNEPLPDLQASRIQFANGVRLNFKSSQNAQDRVEIRIRFGAGQEELRAADIPVARLGAGLLRVGGLGKNDYEDTVRFCEGHACDFDLNVGRDAFVISGATRPVDLDVELQLITAYLSDPGFRPEVDARIPTEIRTLYQVARTEPEFAATLARDRALPAPRILELPDEHDIDGARSADFARVLGPILKNDPLEVTIIGDIGEDAAVAAVARTLGALPPRTPHPESRPDSPRVHFATAAPPLIRIAHEGSPEKATVLATWPLFVWTPDRVREQRTVDLLSQILQMQAIDDIRQRLGKAYSPDVEVQLGRGGDQGDMSMTIDTAPDAAEVVVTELRAIARKLADGDITQEMLERARRPVLDNGATREISNPWWVDMLDGSWAHPDQIASAKTWQSDYQGVTLDEVKAEAKRWLSTPPLVVVAAPATAQAASVPGRPTIAPHG